MPSGRRVVSKSYLVFPMRPSSTPMALALLALLTFTLPPARSVDAPITPAPALDSAKERELLDRVAAEVKRRRQLREADLDARRLVEEHESGKKSAPAAELATARDVIRQADERKAKTTASGATESTSLSLNPATEQERLDRVAAEVQRRRKLLEAAVLDASGLVQGPDSGKKSATAGELTAAREITRSAEERKTNPKTSGVPEGASLSLPGADMSTVAKAWEILFKERVTVAERVATKTVNISLGKLPLPELREKLEAELRRQGVHLVDRPDGKFFDSEPSAARNP